MSAISEEAWRITLTVILEELDEPQYKKMLLFLSEIPKRVKTKSREEMPQSIIEHYGVETSIHRINEVMDQIPRKDAAVQDRLRPFVDKLKNTQQKTGKKRKRSETVLKSVDRKDEAGGQKSCEPDETAGPERPKKKKSRNRSLTPTRAKKTPKVSTVSEKEWKKALSAVLGKLTNSQYDEMLTFLKIPKQKKTAKFKEQLPQKIIERYGVETSIRKIKEALDRIPRRDEVVQKHLRPLLDKLKNKQKKGKRKSCQPDKTGTMKRKKKKAESRDPSLQSTQTAETPRAASASRLQDSDPSEPAELKLEEPDSALSLNGATKTPKGQRAPVQTGRIKIKAVTATKKTNTHLVVTVKRQLKELFVKTRLLAEALSCQMDESVEARIRDALPISAEAKMEGKRIIEIKKI
ncbi:uncharacterized protein LOC115792605 [Archocentrus centrarchus]|uniref:uncharacterized protein LOC115792605 n=1 Tax=Archocentrus centrarchus TaxID=63155 RepID=UPI0011EA0137|nr:uncharacterized protein LOC115792605 [Archocentrus centrarchus]